jgi:hypothetical protein
MRQKISCSKGMAAIKQMTAESTTGKSAQNEVKPDMIIKKRRKKRAKRPAKEPPVESLPLHQPIDSQVLADLAIKIIHLKHGSGTAAEVQRIRWNDAGLHDALDDARRFLLAAKGMIDEDVHAYRLFAPDDGLMSYEEIAQRFSLRQWSLMTSRNKVEKIILELVVSAEKEVQKEREKYEALASVRHRYAGGVYGLADRVRERIRAMVGDFELEVLFSNPDHVADAMGQFFLRLMGSDITGDWERDLSEEFATVAGFNSFIEYVCGGMNYEQFIPKDQKGSRIRMDNERMACLEFFLVNGDSCATPDYKAKGKDLDTLMGFIRDRPEVPDPMVRNLENYLTELRKTPPNSEAIEESAKIAREGLKKFRECIYFEQVVKAQGLRKLITELGSRSNALLPSEQFPAEKIERLHTCLKQTVESVRNLNFEPNEIRALLNRLREDLAQTSLLEVTKVQANSFRGSIAEEMSRVAEGLERGLQTERHLPLDMELSLEKLIFELRSHKGARKCRPYELFLFAAQNRLCREELIRKRSTLVPGVVTGPSHSHSLPILTCHRGAEIAMGVGEPG